MAVADGLLVHHMNVDLGRVGDHGRVVADDPPSISATVVRLALATGVATAALVSRCFTRITGVLPPARVCQIFRVSG